MLPPPGRKAPWNRREDCAGNKAAESPTLSFTMNQTEFPNLRKLLSTFEAFGLGEGDINSGANLLAAMVSCLCQYRSGRRLRVSP